MGLMSGSVAVMVRANTIASRTGDSGGSVGGIKKAGIFGGAVGWPRGNLPASVFWRAPQRTQSLLQMNMLTTKHPVQYKRNGYFSSPMM
jgi:hypothetical protein